MSYRSSVWRERINAYQISFVENIAKIDELVLQDRDTEACSLKRELNEISKLSHLAVNSLLIFFGLVS